MDSGYSQPHGPAGDHQATPVVSVVVPVYNGERVLARCLAALGASRGVAWECIVVDDGSTDGSADIATRFGARYVRAGDAPRGPGRARNLGADAARASLLCFIDADVLVGPDTLAQLAALFAAEPHITAAFGSYDPDPEVREHLSAYRNLLHHFVHQQGHEDASTFWAGCGAVRRDVFLEIGGFDPRYERPSIEDIELGYRLRAAGHSIRLAKHIQVKHLKRWTFSNILRTDIFDRAIPWTLLIQRTGRLPNDLNLDLASRVSAVSVYALLGLVALALFFEHLLLVGIVAPVLLLVVCNRQLYRFFLAQRGPLFLLRALPMHWLYFAYSALVFGGGMVYGRLGLARAPRSGALRAPSEPAA